MCMIINYIQYVCIYDCLLMIIEKWCPQCIAACLRPILIRINKGKHKNQNNGIQQLEEEQFQMRPEIKPSQRDQKRNSKIGSGSMMSVEDQEGVNLSIKMNLSSEKQEQSSTLLQEESIPRLEKFNFNLNLQSYDEHYTLLQNKTNNLKELFDSETTPIITRHTKACVSIGQIESVVGFKMLLSYRLPCSYSFYRRVNGQYSTVCTLNHIITANRIEETLQPNLTLNHLAFKKFMLLQPRFFHYLKYTNSTEEQHWQVATSIRARPQSDPTAKECELTAITCFSQQGQKNLLVHTYLWLDAKSNIKARKVVERVYQQVANYIDNLYDYARRNYRPEQQV